MSNPLESITYRLYVWEVGGSNEEPTDTGRTGSLEQMTEEGFKLANDTLYSVVLPDGRRFAKAEMAGYVVKPEGAK